MLFEKQSECLVAVHCAFIGLENAYDGVPREELWETSIRYVGLIKDLCDGVSNNNCEKCSMVGGEIQSDIELHQGTGLNNGQLTKDSRKESP